MSLMLTCVDIAEEHLAFTNRVYASPLDVGTLNPSGMPNAYVDIKGHILLVEPSESMNEGEIAISKVHREVVRVGLGIDVAVAPFHPPQDFDLAFIKLKVELLKEEAQQPLEDLLKEEALEEMLKEEYIDHIFRVGSAFALDFQDIRLQCTVTEIQSKTSAKRTDDSPRSNLTGVSFPHLDVAEQMGFFTCETTMEFVNDAVQIVATPMKIGARRLWERRTRDCKTRQAYEEWLNRTCTFHPYISRPSVKVKNFKPVPRTPEEEEVWVKAFVLKNEHFLIKRSATLQSKRKKKENAEIDFPFRPALNLRASRRSAKARMSVSEQTSDSHTQTRRSFPAFTPRVRSGLVMRQDASTQVSGFKLVSHGKESKAITTVQLDQEFNDVWYYVASYRPVFQRKSSLKL